MKKLTGILEYDPELRYTPSGKALTIMRVKVGEKDLRVPCEAWEDLAEAIINNDLYRANAMVELIGYWRIREYQDTKYPVFVTRGITILETAPEVPNE